MALSLNSNSQLLVLQYLYRTTHNTELRTWAIDELLKNVLKINIKKDGIKSVTEEVTGIRNLGKPGARRRIAGSSRRNSRGETDLY